MRIHVVFNSYFERLIIRGIDWWRKGKKAVEKSMELAWLSPAWLCISRALAGTATRPWRPRNGLPVSQDAANDFRVGLSFWLALLSVLSRKTMAVAIDHAVVSTREPGALKTSMGMP